MQQENGVILAQKLARLLVGSRLFRVGIMLVLPFLGVVAAFGIAPDTSTDNVARQPVIQELALALPAPADGSGEGYWRADKSS